MTIVLLVSRLALAAVRLIAGIAKSCDLAGSREAPRRFGLPAQIVRIGGTALPLFELVVAAALLPASTARWGVVGAMALLGAFAVAIARALAAGRRPDCHGFGQLHSTSAAVWHAGARPHARRARTDHRGGRRTRRRAGALSWLGHGRH